MHELAICQALMTQVQQVAEKHGARGVERIVLKVGTLSGVEPDLLKLAFEVARVGTVADTAELEIGSVPVVVKCRSCGAESQVAPNRLLCGNCGDWQVNVTAGDELLLVSLDLAHPSPDSGILPAAWNDVRKQNAGLN